MIQSFQGTEPHLDPDAFVAPNATVIGDVAIGARSSIWFGTVVRGDVYPIRIGCETNVQDNSVLHVTGGIHPLHIGDQVSIGHRAVVHGCALGDRVLVGMGAVILDGCKIGEDSIVGAGSVVPEGSVVPPRSVVMGVPGKRVREATPADLRRIVRTATEYKALAAQYREQG
jgi:carbonic anhydrase/acetyltransferase-like protein (isoleucine patch superfamily)